MDFLVRNVDPIAMKKLDELASRKKVSRSEYVRQMIEATAVLEAVSDTNDKYDCLVQTVLQVVMENTETLEQVKDLLEEGSEGIAG